MDEARYRSLARVYDAVMSDVEYPEWIEFMVQRSSREGLPAGPFLDLGCGTGNSTVPALDLGYDVEGLDLSPSMLRVARAKRPAATWHVGDVRTFALPKRYALAYALFDVVNHLLGDDDLFEAVRNVHRHLVPGGWLVFDANTRAGLRHLWTDGRAEGWTGEVHYRWEHRYDESTERAHVQAFCHDGRGDFVEHHVERPYDVPELTSILGAAGFVDVHVTTFPGDAPPTPDEPRIWVFSRRPGLG